MTKQETLSERLVEFAPLVLEDNKRQFGIYMVGVESEKLVYGYDEKSPLIALKRLNEKGYCGQALVIDVSPKNETRIPA